MKIESSGCRVLTVPETDHLDAITIYLQDFTRKGRITVECYGKCWTTYFSAYGDGTLVNFVAKADVGYLVNRFLPSNLGVKAIKNEEIYLRRIVIAVKDALAQIIADCEEEERNDGSPVAAGAKGRDRLDCVADFNTACVDSHTDYAKAMTVRKPEASSDPLAVAARMERAEAENARLREALRKYGHHSFGCPVTMTGASDCYCGLEEALAEAALGKEQNG